MPPSAPAYPDTVEFARAFFREGIRHLEDARHLCLASRHAGSITSSMKASELGVKAALILENAMGLWEKMFTTHKPSTDAEGHAILKQINQALEKHRSNLGVDVRALESLEPTTFVKNLWGSPNTEYPYLVQAVRAAGDKAMELQSPTDYFTDALSLRYYRLSYELLVALPVLYPAMSVWGIPLPETL